MPGRKGGKGRRRVGSSTKTEAATGGLRVVAGRDRTRQKATSEPPPSAVERDRVKQTLGLDALDEVDRQMLQLVLAQPSITDTQIGVVVGLGRQTVNRRRNRPAFEQAVKTEQLDALAILQRNQPRAAKVLGELLESRDEDIRFKAAREHLLSLTRNVDDAAGGADAFARFLEDAAKVAQRKKGTPDKPATEAAAPA